MLTAISGRPYTRVLDQTGVSGILETVSAILDMPPRDMLLSRLIGDKGTLAGLLKIALRHNIHTQAKLARHVGLSRVSLWRLSDAYHVNMPTFLRALAQFQHNAAQGPNDANVRQQVARSLAVCIMRRVAAAELRFQQEFPKKHRSMLLKQNDLAL